jgi:predicted alpha/beta superfamily hydrolase
MVTDSFPCELTKTNTMKKLYSFLALQFLAFACLAQVSVTFRLSLPLHNSTAPYYLATNLNGWSPNDSNNLFKLTDKGTWDLTVRNVNVELFQYKITKGSWDKVEVTKTHNNRVNRNVSLKGLKKDTLVVVQVEAWRDDVGYEPVSSASKNVKILSSDFMFTKLSVKKKVWVYLPEGYATSTKNYPVLYMHDGQNLFDVSTGPYGEWGIDECLDTLMKQLNYELIVVGIDHGAANRLSEYSPYDFTVNPDSISTWKAKGKGRLYLDGLVNELKPYVDKNYRTIKDRENTFIAGSSMGGLISFYAAMDYPDVFSKAGIFSPAFWTIKPNVIEDTKKAAMKWKVDLFMISGKLEGPRYSRDMTDVYSILEPNNKDYIYFEIDPIGEHNEASWGRRFPDFVKWLNKK